MWNGVLKEVFVKDVLSQAPSEHDWFTRFWIMFLAFAHGDFEWTSNPIGKQGGKHILNIGVRGHSPPVGGGGVVRSYLLL